MNGATVLNVSLAPRQERGVDGKPCHKLSTPVLSPVKVCGVARVHHDSGARHKGAVFRRKMPYGDARRAVTHIVIKAYEGVIMKE